MGHESAKFYQEDLGVQGWVAENIARFMDVAMDCSCVKNPNAWVSDDGAVCRAYFSVWSQNRFPPTEFYHKSYYCPESDDVFFEDICGEADPLSKVARYRKDLFSGAKTRKAIEQFAGRFYAKNI